MEKNVRTMVGVVLLTHLNLGETLLETAQRLCGVQSGVRVLSQRPDTDFATLHKNALQAVKEVDAGRGVLFLVDIYGGTPSNVARSMLDQSRNAMVTGINLSMLIKIFESNRARLSAGELAAVAAEAGCSAIERINGVNLAAPASRDENKGKGEGEREKDKVLERQVEVVNTLGLHASASAKLVQAASRYEGSLTLERDGMEVSGKSITSVMMLAASKGTKLLIRASGAQADQLMDEVCELFEDGFGED